MKNLELPLVSLGAMVSVSVVSRAECGCDVFHEALKIRKELLLTSAWRCFLFDILF